MDTSTDNLLASDAPTLANLLRTEIADAINRAGSATYESVDDVTAVRERLIDDLAIGVANAVFKYINENVKYIEPAIPYTEEPVPLIVEP